MKIKYSGNKAVEFIRELENFDINNINIEIYDDIFILIYLEHFFI